MTVIKETNRYRALEILMHAKQRHHMDYCTWSVFNKAFFQLLEEVNPSRELENYLFTSWYLCVAKGVRNH